MIKGKQNILDYYDAQPEYPFWIIYPDKGSRGSSVDRSSDFDALGKQEGRKTLGEAINRLLPGTRYYLVMKNTPSQNKGYFETQIELDEQVNPTNTHQAMQPSGIYGIQDVEAIAEKKAVSLFEKLKAENEVERLREKNAALEKEIRELEKSISPVESRIAGFMDAYPQLIAQAIGAITANLSGNRQRVGVAGFGPGQPKRKKPPVDVEPIEQSSDDQARMETALEAWNDADPEFIAVIEKIAYCAVNNPDQYNMYKPMILSIK